MTMTLVEKVELVAARVHARLLSRDYPPPTPLLETVHVLALVAAVEQNDPRPWWRTEAA